MKRFAFAAIGLLLPLAVAASPASAQAKRNYDCSKAGNANKAACKGATPAATKPAPAPAVKPATTARTYDCTKPGNANKAACKAATPAPATKPTAAAAPKARNYDCTKPGNANKAVCKGAAAPVAAAPRAAPAAHPAAVSHASGDKPTNPGGPNGATAQCKDGTYSKSTHHSGTCSGHKGVATWY